LIFLNYRINNICRRQRGGRGRALMEWLRHFAIYNDGEGVLVNDLTHGKHYIKFPRGNLANEFNYINGKLHGTQYTWYSTCQLRNNDNYHCGKRHGIQYTWSISGQLIEKRNYQHGVAHGEFTAWLSCGKWWYTDIYVNGVKIRTKA
jgi:antitoxin component YwqK of YwqJK toxin-antitoxin module